MRRGPALAVLLCLLGAFVVLVAAGRTWLAGAELLPAPLPARDIALDAGDLGLPLRALGLVGLAGVPALAATRRNGRIAVGVVLLLTGLAVVVPSAGVLLDPAGAAGPDAGAAELSVTAWPALAVAGGLLLGAAGLGVAVRGRSWAALGRRYDAPAAGAATPAAAPTTAPTAAPTTAPARGDLEPSDRQVTERELWEALDRGEDPTGPAAGDPRAR